jgi:hypothetical protein
MLSSAVDYNSRVAMTVLSHNRLFFVLCVLALAGCGPQPVAPAVPVSTRAVAQTPRPKPAAQASPPARPKPSPQPAPKGRGSEAPAPPIPVRTLEDLAEAAKKAEFNLPALEEGKIAAAGIRTLGGRHITLYTDLPPGAEIDEMPAVFDAAVPLWARQFNVPEATVADWRLVGSVIRDKERFVGAGLYPPSLLDFPHGYSQGSQLWLFEQPSAYYRRHLLLHEGTHCFMNRWLGGAGPPWYMEGLAELLATHRWAGGKLTLGIMPASREELPYWGRVKIVKDEFKEGRGMSLPQIMQYDAHAHLRQEPYGWCWAAAAFFDGHPLTQAAFRELKSKAADRSIDFSQDFANRLREQWPAITQDWTLFVQECDYGYDFARAAVVFKPAQPLPAGGATVTVDSARGWQASGYSVVADKQYAIATSGRFEVAKQPQPWPCEAGGVTIRYHAGRPLGMLLASVDLDEFVPLGMATTLSPTKSGPLYFKINEAAGGLADNQGALTVAIRQSP